MNLPFPHRLIVAFLNTLARLVLWSRQPFIIGVTGSVGKSSAKEAIAAVLGRHLSVRASVGNLNNEFGLPLAILGAKESPGRSPWKWLRLGAESILVILRLRPYPAHLVLEMGVDRPGDMERHVSVARPHLSVLTRIAESHLAAFGTVPNIAKEKRKILSALSENGIAVLNADDPLVMKQAEIVKGKILTYGVEAEADVRADNIRLIQEGARLEGLSFKLNYAGTTIPVRLPGVIGRHHIPAVLAAATVALALKLNLVDIAAALSLFRPLPGRFRLLSGEGDIRLIDDTYNASFVSTAAALATLRETIAPRKVVVLGDMLEIGEGARESHRALRDAVIASGATVFVGVGQYMQHLADALRSTTFPGKAIYVFPDPERAREALPALVRSGDLVLIKGSQGLRMETVAAALLEESVARRELCRQSKRWRVTPFRPPEEWGT